MPKPLLGGGGARAGATGPRLRLLLSQGGRRRQVLPGRHQLVPDQHWDAVIQFSARHLFCPAHASTKTTSVRTGALATSVNRHCITHPITAAQHFLLAKPRLGRRKLSNAAALTSDPSMVSPYSTEHERHQQLEPDTSLTASISRSAAPSPSSSGRREVYRSSELKIIDISFPGANTETSSPPQTSRTTKPAKVSESRTAPWSGIAPSPSPTPAGTPISTRSKQHHDKVASWRFPTLTTPDRSLHSRSPDPVQSWASTSKALSHLYSSLHDLKSVASSTSSSFSASSSSPTLRAALIHYNFLSRLQSQYDTILVPRRETRMLFLLQGREPKTSANLEQLLRMAMDLIWLNEKERKRRRLNKQEREKLDASDASSTAGTVAAIKASGTTMGLTAGVASTMPIVPYVRRRADDYHGLRVSEYTILMNWIGSVAALSDSSPEHHPRQSTDTSAQSSSPSSPANALNQESSTTHGGPVDRAWGIWQDFLLTGMKPDVVLYTALIETLLKAKDFDRADQIWNHMHQQDKNEDKHHRLSPNLGSEKYQHHSNVNGTEHWTQAHGPVSETLQLGTNLGSSPSLGVEGRRKPKPSRSRPLQEPDHHRRSRSAVVPNMQTFSVLMQTHVLNQDLRGVAQTYKELLQSGASPASMSATQLQLQHLQQGGGLQRFANTVLLNQILKALVDLGEATAARKIYAEMRADTASTGTTILESQSGDGGGDHGAPSPDQGNRVEEKEQEEEAIQNGDYTSEADHSLPSLLSSAPAPGAPGSLLSASPLSQFLSPPVTTATARLTPLHHQAFLRRSIWEKQWRRETRAKTNMGSGNINIEAHKQSNSKNNKANLDSRSSSSIRPDETTHKLILELARREGDRELEEIVLKDLYPCMS